MRVAIRNSLAAMLKRGLLHVIVSNVVQQGAAFLTVMITAKLLMPSDFALVRIALAYVAIGTVIAAGGLTAPVLRYCADANFSEAVRRFLLGRGVQRLLIVSVAVVVVAMLLTLLKYESQSELVVLSAYALQLPGLALASLFLVYLQAVQQFKVLASFQVIIRVMALCVTAIATYLYGLTGLLLAALLMTYLACVPLYLLSRPIFTAQDVRALPSDFTQLARYSMVGTLISTVGQYADILILDMVGVENSQIAIYSLATIFFFAASALIGAVQGVVTPAFTVLLNEPEQFRRQLHRWSIMMSLAGLPIAFFMVALAYAAQTWFLDEHYRGLAPLLILLMVKFCLWCTFAVGGAALVGIGAIRQGTWIATATTLVAIAVGYPLCSYFGIWGAAWTQVVISVVSAGLIWWTIVVQTRALQVQGLGKPLAGPDHLLDQIDAK